MTFIFKKCPERKFEHMDDKAAGKLENVFNEGYHELYSSLNMTRMSKSTGNISCIVENKIQKTF